jgi:hypothetical protein
VRVPETPVAVYHPVPDSLNRRKPPWEEGIQFWKDLLQALAVFGNSFLDAMVDDLTTGRIIERILDTR